MRALRLVDRDGLAALNMRSLATALGTGPMTLYNYVRDREGLEELVVDAVISAVELPPPTANWRSDTIRTATAIWRAVRAHPAAVPLVLTRRSTSAAVLGPAETLIAALRRSPLDDRDLLAAFRAVLSLVMGSAQAELAGPSRRRRQTPRLVSARWPDSISPTSRRSRTSAGGPARKPTSLAASRCSWPE